MPRLLFLLCCAASTVALQLSPARLDWLREAEKKHGRVAMAALPALATIASVTGEDPLPWLNSQPAASQLVFYSAAGLLETVNLKRFGKGFTLKPGETPGRVIPFLNASENLQFVEDVSGRVAMLATAAMLASALPSA